MDRRGFLKTGLLTGTGLALGASRIPEELRAERGVQASGASLPLVVSMWRVGLEANAAAMAMLASGGSALDAVQQGAMVAEADAQVRTVGIGGRPNRDGIVELDAAIMDGATLHAGAVAALRDIKHPVAVARKVMEETPHVMLAGEGARRFALAHGFELDNLLTPESREEWELKKSSSAAGPDNHDTIGLLAREPEGNIAAACSTSGMAYKLPGRVGDSPLIGAGLYADNEAGGAAATGIGEEIIRVCGCYQIVEFMRQGLDPQEAIHRLIERLVRRNPANGERLLAFIAMRADGEVGFGSTVPGFQVAVSRGSSAQLLDVSRWRRGERD